MGTQYHKYLWWKKYLTTLQMIQFVAIMVHAFQLLFIDCNYPRAFVWWIGMHAVMFFFLFNEFYRQTYKDAKERRRRAEANRIMQATEKMLGICTNGTLSSRSEYSNGSAMHDDGEEQHLVGNGTAKTASKAADYYVRGEVPADITQRKIIEK
uniref:Putative fatty acyl-coa elongase/polyunsaturated fatty acid specific elongation enzyme n=1 Tax=Lutzomyia longipalpis TaxID=7200 RepID=A0A7G3AHX0_LUTLO